ncbi:MAG: phenylalanine 4-monooxygenase [Hyphomonadaceae bacterium]
MDTAAPARHALPDLPPGAFSAPLIKPAHVGEDWLEAAQRVYTADDDAIWDELYARQMALLPDRAAQQFFDGIERLQLGAGGVPDINRLSAQLHEATGWVIVPVPSVIPDHVFFHHLANRRFPAGNFIRTRETMNYIMEPDVFHDVFGHTPMLIEPKMADFIQKIGENGLNALRHNKLKALGALYWYTVEFGLVDTPQGFRLYGAGIASSPQETVFSLEGRSPNRLHFSLDRVMRTDYVTSDLQQTYFVIDSFDDLFRETAARQFDFIYSSLKPSFQYATSAVLETDRIYQLGTQEYALRGGRGSRAAPA